LDLPTYTNIWRIEKRLYKLYDFRLPMPLPVGQIAVFAAIAVPYVVILKVAGLPFSHTLLWLYILPPGALAWLVTRPVLEGKRLPELVVSQVRYLTEPRTWCRMAPLAEKDEVLIVARVWRRLPGRPAEEEVAVGGAAFAEAALGEAAFGEAAAAEVAVGGDARVVEAPGDEEEPAAAAEPALAASQEIREAPLPDRRGWPYRAATIRAPAPPPVAREATAQGAPGPASAGAARPVATPAPAAQAPAAAPPVPVPAAPAASAPGTTPASGRCGWSSAPSATRPTAGPSPGASRWSSCPAATGRAGPTRCSATGPGPGCRSPAAAASWSSAAPRAPARP
jgi:hypothetical protein